MLQQDKIQHFSVSFLLMFVFQLLFGIKLSFLITLLIGICKEIYDHYYGTGFSIEDLIANFIGIGFAILIFIIK